MKNANGTLGWVKALSGIVAAAIGIAASCIAIAGGAKHKEEEKDTLKSSIGIADPAKEYTIAGRAYDVKTGKPLVGADVIVEGNGVMTATTTKANGFFSITFRSTPAKFEVTFRADGYQTAAPQQYDPAVTTGTGTFDVGLTPNNLVPAQVTSPEPIDSDKPSADTPDQGSTGLGGPSTQKTSQQQKKQSVTVAKPKIFDMLSKTATNLYGDRFDNTANIRKQFDAVFSHADEDKLAESKVFMNNYARFCYWALPLHADHFNEWFAQSSDDAKKKFLLGMKQAVFAADFRNAANPVIDEVNSDFEFTMFGDIAFKSSDAAKILNSVTTKSLN